MNIIDSMLLIYHASQMLPHIDVNNKDYIIIIVRN